ncbi:sugar ABC transporter substrate-binding protein [Nonomuraea glycinis]|uniref:Sugar ABC transporter substrate-binding protein n=1 Tax=Nonomuraea glycinis TaxID=2047744 RepID=A0A918A1V8_9ACTN|nr:sugar ABC transporter substrate-binding protein [Nonomuraea glycinis]MCA2183284.1 sugar ABC transporter substrate-binding protein [Nonomuraea glycinis]GGP04439.1 sugar ABC transporter substrate-binding protein [Nonomuraea glycinis]
MQGHLRSLAAAATAALLLSACGAGAPEGGQAAAESATIDYWLWDVAQQPQYQACADAFQKANPNYKVKITQYGWDDYWNTLTTAFVSGTAPDVFVSHLSRYPDFAAQGTILPIDDQVAKDKVDLSLYQDGLADLWVTKDGKRYGLPKDFDTVAVIYNSELLKDAGLKPEDMEKLEWNPKDGGSYEKTIAHLTVDKNGKRGDEPGFDKTKVAVYGIGLAGSGAGFGQTEWSMYAMSNGWQYADQNPWPSRFNYADPKFKETITWFTSLIDKGYMPSMAIAGAGVNQMDAYGAGKYAMVTEGSWNTKSYWNMKGVKSVLAPTPVGPTGKRASLFNGLADNISAATDNPDAAWAWVKFLGSPACQEEIVADEAVIFPAIKSARTRAEQAFGKLGIDVKPFTMHVEEGTTHLAPIADHWADITATMTETMDAIFSRKADVSSLDGANERVNGLFG